MVVGRNLRSKNLRGDSHSGLSVRGYCGAGMTARAVHGLLGVSGGGVAGRGGLTRTPGRAGGAHCGPHRQTTGRPMAVKPCRVLRGALLGPCYDQLASIPIQSGMD
jgi:hypothetical protein